MKHVLSLSGGMDSTALLLNILRKSTDTVYCFSFNYGQKHNVELQCAKTVVEYLKAQGYDIQHQIVDISDVMRHFNSNLIQGNADVPTGFYEQDNMKLTVVPNRNAIFSSIIYGYALSIATKENCEVSISLGVHAGDHAIYPDCREEFIFALKYAFDLGNWDSERISYYIPYIDINKADILRDALDSCENLKLDFDYIFKNTNTSYNPLPDGTSDGETGSDVERILAFNEIGRKDPFVYSKPWEAVLQNALKTQNDFNNAK